MDAFRCSGNSSRIPKRCCALIESSVEMLSSRKFLKQVRKFQGIASGVLELRLLLKSFIKFQREIVNVAPSFAKSSLAECTSLQAEKLSTVKNELRQCANPLFTNKMDGQVGERTKIAMNKENEGRDRSER